MAPSVLPSSVPARPALETRCTCVWPGEHARQARVAEAYAKEQSRVDALSQPLSTIASVPGAVYDSIAQTMSSSSSTMPGSLGGGGNQPGTGSLAVTPAALEQFNMQLTEPAVPQDSSGASSSTPHASYGYTTSSGTAGPNGQLQPPGGGVAKVEQAGFFPSSRTQEDETKTALEKETKKRMSAKKSHIKTGVTMTMKADTPARKVKRIFRLTPEMKLRDLLACREDLVVILQTLIPTYQQAETASPVARADTRLCQHCTTLLAYALYHSPARLDNYIREGSTRAFLAYVDDAVVSLENDVRMETVSHRDLEMTLRAELAVVEWRMAMKLAGIHKKNRIADLFPLKVGQFAELNVSQEGPPTKPGGLLKRGAMAAAGVVGLGKPAYEGTHKQIARGAGGNSTAM